MLRNGWKRVVPVVLTVLVLGPPVGAIAGVGDGLDGEIDEAVDAVGTLGTKTLEEHVDEEVERKTQEVAARLPEPIQSTAQSFTLTVEKTNGESSDAQGSDNDDSTRENDDSTRENETSGPGGEWGYCISDLFCSGSLLGNPGKMIPPTPLPIPGTGWSPAPDWLKAPGGSSPGPSSTVTPQQEKASPAEDQKAMANVIAIATAAAATVAATAMVTATTPVGSQVLAGAARWLAAAKRWLWLGLGLYARISKDKVLDHGTRNQILEFLRANPGSCMTEIQSAVLAGFTTIRHHLDVLHSNGLVTDVKNGRRRCFFAIENAGSRMERRATAVLSSASAKRVYSVIEKRPGIRQQELAAALNVTSTSVIFHTRRLEAAGVVQRGQSGRAVAYFPVQAASA